MEKVLDDKLDQIVNLYFKGYSVAKAIEVIRNEAIQTSSGSTRANRTV